MKIGVCLPTFNEADNIGSILKKIDRFLISYLDEYDVVIVNADNNSKDGTNKIFNETKTVCRKESIITNEIGKGNNLLSFFKYCSDNSIDYALTIDADIKEINRNWIDDFIGSLVLGCDYVTPIYKRSRYEGSTTNHFAFPIIYGITGKCIRQPIAGDFGFNQRFVQLILKQKVNDSIRKYGIDIFMTLTAAYYGLNVGYVLLDKKVHNPSFGKMENMFQEVLDAFVFTWRQYYDESYLNSVVYDEFLMVDSASILPNKDFGHKDFALDVQKRYGNKIAAKDLEVEWINSLVNIIVNPGSVDDQEKRRVFYLFMLRATSFWLSAQNKSALRCEEEIIKQANELKRVLCERRGKDVR